MSEQANRFKLGLFVVVSVAMLLVGAAVLGAGSFLKQTMKVETYLDESAQGLDIGAPVKNRGVTIGKVSKIGFVGDKYSFDDKNDKLRAMRGLVLVEMKVDLTDRHSRLIQEAIQDARYRGLRARMASEGLMGSAYIELVWDRETIALEQVPWIPNQPYIPATKSVMGQITSSVERVAKQLESARIDQVIGDVQKLVKNIDNQVQAIDIKAMTADATSLLAEVRATNARVKAILDRPAIDTAIDDVAGMARSLKNMTGDDQGQLRRFISDLPEISARVKSVAAQLDDVLSDPQTKGMLTNLNTGAASVAPATADLRRLIRRLDTMLSSQQQDLEAIVTGLKKTVESANAVAEDAAQNPARVLFGEPPPRTSGPSSSGKK